MEKIIKSDQVWRKLLTPEQYRVARKKGTEPPFTGAYWNTKAAGVYKCACCGLPLFDSEHKFDSGTGWPSFWQAIDEKSVQTQRDESDDKIRTEVLCTRCAAHLGHLFNDGPAPTALRYCMNSAALKLVEIEAGAE